MHCDLFAQSAPRKFEQWHAVYLGVSAEFGLFYNILVYMSIIESFGVLVSMLTNAPDSASTADKSGFLQVVNRICFDEKDQNKNQKHGFRESETEREQNAHTVRKYCTTSTVSPDITHATECLITFASTHDIAVCAHGVSLRLLCLGGCYVLRYALPNWGSKTGN